MYKIDCPKLIDRNNDHFNLYTKVEGIQKFLESTHSQKILKHNNLIALYGEWGSGKSSIVKTINANLNKENFNSFILKQLWTI